MADTPQGPGNEAAPRDFARVATGWGDNPQTATELDDVVGQGPAIEALGDTTGRNIVFLDILGAFWKTQTPRWPVRLQDDPG